MACMSQMSQTLPCMTMQNRMPQTMPDTTSQQYLMPQISGAGGLDTYIYPQNLPEALRLIQEALTGETEDRQFYQYLIEKAPAQEDKEIIKGIRDDEMSHFNLFRQLYYQLTGQTLPLTQNVTFERPASYCDGLKSAISGEQNAVRKYRKILFAMQARIHINILTGIITDEIRHGSLYNYLYAKNGCRV
jgi:rubrerythrin